MKRSQARFSVIFIFLKPCKTFDQRSLNGQKKILMLHIAAMILISIIIKGASCFLFEGGGGSTRAKMGNELRIILCNKWEVIRLLIFGYAGLGSLDEGNMAERLAKLA